MNCSWPSIIYLYSYIIFFNLFQRQNEVLSIFYMKLLEISYSIRRQTPLCKIKKRKLCNVTVGSIVCIFFLNVSKKYF